jgi:UDP-GlcNAc:undecaprenyl-phosphate GlcNAc-1-phosphate transferase
MIQLLFFVCLLLILLAYFKLADKYNIIDKPNQRSSHTEVTIRGGGVLFPISILIWSFVVGVFNPFIIGLVLISVVSFIDDCKPLSNKIRISIHFLSIGLLLYQLGFSEFSYLSWAFGLLFIGGWINAYNFMDGINGITVLYSLSVLTVCYYLNLQHHFAPHLFINYTLMGLMVFGFYNVRKKAKTFAGDVGSVSMAFILAFILVSLLLKSANWQYILLVSVYGIDTLVTIVERLRKKENIFKAHRSHLYQYLANEAKWSHVRVSILYAVIQLVLNVILIFYIIPLNSHSAAVAYLILLGGIYLGSKNLLLQKLKK